MKVFYYGYIIFLIFYTIESGRMPIQENTQNKTIALSVTTKNDTVNSSKNITSNNGLKKAIAVLSTTSSKIPKENQKFKVNNNKQRQNIQTQITEKVKKGVTTSRYQNQHIELPTYHQQIVESFNNSKNYVLNNVTNDQNFSNINEIKNNNRNIKMLTNYINKNEQLKYGMKTIPKTSKYLQTNGKTLIKDYDKIKRQNEILNSAKNEEQNNIVKTVSEKYENSKQYLPANTTKPFLLHQPTGPTKIQLSQEFMITSSKGTLICPKQNEAQFNLFAVNCKTDNECTIWNTDFRCCELFGSKACHRGVPKPLTEPEHSPILGIIPRKCPERPLAELFWELKTCVTDADCWPRICCPDGKNKYCRTSTPKYESVPFQFGRSLAYVSEYLECSPPPPLIFDLHPKPCNSTLDCFPNVCCQEAGKKNCRPPKRSVLSFMGNFLNNGFFKRLTNN